LAKNEASSEDREAAMKKSCVFLLFIFLVSEASAWDFKFLGGANLSSYSIYPTKISSGWFGDYYRHDTSYQPGFLVGVGIEWSLAKRVAMEIDVLYFKKGSEITLFRLDELYWETDYVLNVISVPVLIKLKALPDSSPYFVHGGELSYTLSHKYSYARYPEYPEEPTPQQYPPESIKESTKRLSFGVVVGAGWEIKIRSVSVLVEARYHFGLVNILSEDQGAPPMLDSIKPNSQVILCALKF
jgi:hypothetical protein